MIITNTDKEQNTTGSIIIHRRNKGTIRRQVNVTIN